MAIDDSVKFVIDSLNDIGTDVTYIVDLWARVLDTALQ